MNVATRHTRHTQTRRSHRSHRRHSGTVHHRRRNHQDGVRLSRNARSHRSGRARRVNAPQVSHRGPVSGTQLARDAQRIAASGIAGSGRNCFRGVKYAMARQGVNLSGVPAYTAAGQLARNPNFREVRLGRAQLGQLPPGATVVWAPHGKHRNGHVSIALGNGREASDVLRNQITNYGSSFRVFMPNRA